MFLFVTISQGHFIAIPGNTEIKILDTRSMTFVDTKAMAHNVATNCCAFNVLRQNSEQNYYVLATGDIAGNVMIWSMKYENNALTVSELDRCGGGGGGICEIVWKDKDELLCCTMSAGIYRYRCSGGDVQKSGDNAVESKEMESEATGSMDVDKSQKKKRFEDDSDEDFDIDMDDDEDDGSKKIVLRKDAESDTSPEPETETKTKTENDAKSAVANGTDQKQQLQDDVEFAILLMDNVPN